MADEHVAQLLGYLKSTRMEHGLLINFGSYRFAIKKYVMSEAMAAKERKEHKENSPMRSLRSFAANSP